MTDSAVDQLKLSGNEAFKDGQYDKALNLYDQAIEMEKAMANDFKKLSILYSNSSHVQIKKEK